MALPSKNFLVAHWKMNDNTSNSIITDSIGLHDGTWAYGTTDASSVAGKINTAMYFDGTNYVSVADNSNFNLQTFSFCTWLKHSDRLPNWDRILSKKINYEDTNGYEVTLSNADDSILYISSSSGSWATINLGITTWTDQQWHHLAVIYKDSTVQAYCDSTFKGSAPVDSSVISNTNPLLLGKLAGEGDTLWQGAVDDARYYNMALSFNNIRSIYNGGVGTEDETSNAAEMGIDTSPSFGWVPVGDTKSVDFVVQNTGDLNLSVGQITSPSTPFSLTSDNVSNTTLTPDQTNTFTITFSPSSSGNYSSTINVPSNDPASPFHLNLTGTTTRPIYYINAGSSNPSYPYTTVETGANNVYDLIFGETPVTLIEGDTIEFVDNGIIDDSEGIYFPTGISLTLKSYSGNTNKPTWCLGNSCSSLTSSATYFNIYDLNVGCPGQLQLMFDGQDITNLTIERCQFTNAILAIFGCKNVVRNNIFNHSILAFILQSAPLGIIINNNDFYAGMDPGYAIYFFDEAIESFGTVRILNNIIHTYSYGIYADSGNPGGDVLINYNDIFNTTNPISGVDPSYIGPNNIFVNPLFADSFSLLAGSPCIGTGITDPTVPTDDYNGRNRSAPIDMGAVLYSIQTPAKSLPIYSLIRKISNNNTIIDSYLN